MKKLIDHNIVIVIEEHTNNKGKILSINQNYMEWLKYKTGEISFDVTNVHSRIKNDVTRNINLDVSSHINLDAQQTKTNINKTTTNYNTSDSLNSFTDFSSSVVVSSSLLQEIEAIIMDCIVPLEPLTEIQLRNIANTRDFSIERLKNIMPQLQKQVSDIKNVPRWLIWAIQNPDFDLGKDVTAVKKETNYFEIKKEKRGLDRWQN